MRRFLSWRNILIAFAIVFGLIIVILVVWMFVAGPVTVLRVLRYGDTNIDDFSHYPGRELSPSPAPLLLERTEAEIQIPPDILAAAGVDTDLESLLEANDTIAFLVLKDDTLLYERYFQGHTASSRSQLFSVSKSVTSALVGLAIRDGYFAGTDQPITDFVPELAGAGFGSVTIHHLLTMTSGSAYRENDNPFGEHVILNYTPRLEERILRFEMNEQPGSIFRYKSGDTALVGLALARALAPETITDYAQRRLWAPLGMEDAGIWTIDHARDGLEKTWCCLATSARDLAKFGQLYLRQGQRAEEEIVPAEWVEASTNAQVPAVAWPDDYRAIGWRGYGYQWWLASEEDGDYFALGKDGQFLYVNPTRSVVIVRLGWSEGELFSSQWIRIFQNIAVAAS